MKTKPADYGDHNDELLRLRHQEANLKARIEALERRVKWLENGMELFCDIELNAYHATNRNNWLAAEPKA